MIHTMIGFKEPEVLFHTAAQGHGVCIHMSLHNPSLLKIKCQVLRWFLGGLEVQSPQQQQVHFLVIS